MRTLDEVEDLPRTQEAIKNEGDDWNELVAENEDPVDFLAALRQWIVDKSWEKIIIRNITDWLERRPHMAQGKFNFKSPSAVLGVCRARG